MAGNNIIKIKTFRYPDYLPDKKDAGKVYKIEKRAKKKKNTKDIDPWHG